MSLFVSLDLETLGVNRDAPIIEFGGVLADWLTGKRLCQFHTYVTHDSYDNCEPYAMSMHSEILRRIACKDDQFNYTHIDELTKAFNAWCLLNGIGPAYNEKITFAGKNLAGFDLPMLERQASGWTEWARKYIHHRVIDPTVLFWNPISDECLPGSDECRQRAGIERADNEKHNALSDADDVVEMICRAVGRRVSPQRLFDRLYE